MLKSVTLGVVGMAILLGSSASQAIVLEYYAPGNASEPILLLHGYHYFGGGHDYAEWNSLIESWKGSEPSLGKSIELVRLGYHACDENVDEWLDRYSERGAADVQHGVGASDIFYRPFPDTPADHDSSLACNNAQNKLPWRGSMNTETSIEHLAYHFAWAVHLRYSVQGTCVKVVARDMGAVIVLLALRRVAQGTGGFPSEMCISHLTTLDAPFYGSKVAELCVKIPEAALSLVAVVGAGVLLYYGFTVTLPLLLHKLLVVGLSVAIVEFLWEYAADHLFEEAMESLVEAARLIVSYGTEYFSDLQCREMLGDSPLLEQIRRPIPAGTILTAIGSAYGFLPEGDRSVARDLDIGAAHKIVYEDPGMLGPGYDSPSPHLARHWDRQDGGSEGLALEYPPREAIWLSLTEDYWGCGSREHPRAIALGVRMAGRPPAAGSECWYVAETPSGAESMSFKITSLWNWDLYVHPDDAFVDLGLLSWVEVACWSGSSEYGVESCGLHGPRGRYLFVARTEEVPARPFFVEASARHPNDCRLGMDAGDSELYAGRIPPTVDCRGVLSPADLAGGGDWYQFGFGDGRQLDVTISHDDPGALLSLYTRLEACIHPQADPPSCHPFGMLPQRLTFTSDPGFYGTWYLNVRSVTGPPLGYRLILEATDAAPNGNPTAPLIECDKLYSLVDESVHCTIESKDESPGLFYEIDWGDGHRTRVPPEGYVAPDVTQTAQHAWSTASHFTITTWAVDAGTPPMESGRQRVGHVVLATAPVCSGPPNDCFAHAFPVPPAAEVLGTNAGATLESQEPYTTCGGEHVSRDKSVWYVLAPTNDVDLTVGVSAQGFDPVLGVFVGSSVGQLTELTCNDNALGTDPSLRFLAKAGNVYYFQVSGYLGASGDFRLKVVASQAVGAANEPASLPACAISGLAHDCFLGARSIGGIPFSDTLATYGTTVEEREPRSCGVGSTVWYKLLLSAPTWLAVSAAGSEFDTVVAAYSGATLDDLSLVACNDDAGDLASELVFKAEAGVSYHLQVGGLQGGSGSLKLALRLADTSPPETSVEIVGWAAESGWHHPTIELRMLCADDLAGCSRTRYSIDGGATWYEYSASSPPRLSQDGVFEVVYQSNDAMGNEEEPKSLVVHLDGQPPDIELSSSCEKPGDEGWCRSAVAYSVSTHDATSGLAPGQPACLIDHSYAPCVGSVSGSGRHTLVARSRDLAGNVAERSFTLLVDVEPPVVAQSTTCASQGRGGWCRSAGYSYGGTAFDPSRGSGLAGDSPTCWVDLLQAPCSGTVTGPGMHSVNVYAVDVAGNAASYEVQTGIDPSAPSLEFGHDCALRGRGDWCRSPSFAFAASSQDASPGSGLAPGSPWCAHNGDPVPCQKTIGTQGMHEFALRSSDVAGNLAQRVERLGIDSGPPVLDVRSTCLVPGDAGWCRNMVRVDASALDAASGVHAIACTLDRQDLASCTRVDVSLQGEHAANFVAEDAAGNVASFEAPFKIDSIPPSTALALRGNAGENGWYVGPVTASLSATDATSGVVRVSKRLGGGAWEAYTSPIDLVLDGTHALEYRSLDLAGNEEAVARAEVRIDGTPPVVRGGLAGREGLEGWYVGPVIFSLAAEDATSGVAVHRKRLDGGTWTPYRASGKVSANGEHSLEQEARDRAGNVGLGAVLRFKIDATPPRTQASVQGAPGAEGWWRGPVTVSLAAADAHSGVRATEMRVDGGSWVAFAGPIVLAEEGPHVLEFRSFDRAGNEEAARQLLVRIDGTAPAVDSALDGPEGTAGWFRGPVIVTLHAVDGQSGVASLRRSVDGGAWSPYAGAPLVLRTDGVHEVAFAASDVAGNVAPTARAIVHIDATPPSASHSASPTPGPRGWSPSRVTVHLAASDGDSGVAGLRYRMGSGDWLDYFGAFDVTKGGKSVVEYSARDVAGNEGPIRSFEVLVDDAPPQVAWELYGPEGREGWFRGPVAVALTASDEGAGLVSVECRTDGGAWVPYERAFDVGGDGVHLVEARALDGAGLTGFASFRVLIDTEAPASIVTYGFQADADGRTGGAAEVHVVATDELSGGVSTWVSVDGGEPRPYAGAFLVAGDGEHAIEAWSEDVAGNRERTPRRVTLRIEAVAEAAS